MLDAVSDLVVIVGADGRVAELGAAARGFLGERVTPGTGLSQLTSVVAAAGRERVESELRRTLSGRGMWRGTVNLLDAHDHPVPYAVTLAAAPDGGLALVARDTTDLRAREAAERESLAKDEFIARLGHELRTPLNAVLGFAQLLELEPLSPEQREDVERILSGGRHMQALLDDVLDLARIRAGGGGLEVGPVPVMDVIHGVVELVEPLAEARAIRRIVSPAEPITAIADRRRLWQVVLNLVGNAVKYGREGGYLRVGVVPLTGGRIRIEVEDDGIGMTQEAVRGLFRPFERLGAERSGVEGSGLGLALSKALVTAMGGALTATSRPGVGSLFAVVVDGGGPEIPKDAPTGPIALRRVVHVTADAGAQVLVGQALRNRLGAETVTCAEVSHVADLVRRTRPGLVLVDGQLANGAAAGLLYDLATDPATAAVPAVVLTTDTDPVERGRLRDAGAVDVLDVPLDMRALLDVAGALLAHR